MTSAQLNSETSFLDGLTDLQKQWFHDPSPPHLFAVVSWGCAATAWLAKVLNSHKDIFCVHAANGVWEAFGQASKLDGLEYLRILRVQGRHYAVAGDVHGFDRKQIAGLKALLPGMFSSAVLVREPIARLRSQLALFDGMADQRFWNISYVDTMIDRLGLVLPNRDYHTKLFIHGACLLNAITEEAQDGKVFRQEDLTADPEVLRALIREVTAGKISPATGWCSDALQIRGVNPHDSSRRPLKFEEWQLNVLRRVVNPEAWKLYADLGYPTPGFL
ncbi:MAG TPA: hypothetical protein VKT81_25195 [Bryobacteraceae bacterium]|nr:hypothetical protein [Bryobacteraceae bacterium]